MKPGKSSCFSDKLIYFIQCVLKKNLFSMSDHRNFFTSKKCFKCSFGQNVEFNVYLIYENDESISPEVSFLMSFENLFFNFVNEH